jgi:hypothetical protein
MSSRIEGSLDEPFFTAGDTDDRGRASGHHRDVELVILSSDPTEQIKNVLTS